MGSAWSCIVTTFVRLVEKDEETQQHLLDETRHMSTKKVFLDSSYQIVKGTQKKPNIFYNPIGNKERETRMKFPPTQSPRLKSIPEESIDVI